MGVYADMMSRLVLTVKSPDGAVTATLSDRDRLAVEFRPGAYDFYAEEPPLLERQIAGFAQLVWTGRRRASLAALSTVLGREITGREQPDSIRRRAFVEARDSLDLVGHSAQGHITLRTKGWLRWRVDIADRTLDRLTEESFSDELASAVRALLADYTARSSLLRDEVYA